jgi:hypothetical protein
MCGPTRFRGFLVMFRFPNWNTRATITLKGSEFRILIQLDAKREFVSNQKQNGFRNQTRLMKKFNQDWACGFQDT